MSEFILNRPLTEHHCYFENGELFENEKTNLFSQIYFKGNPKKAIYQINKSGQDNRITTSFFVGVDWLISEQIAIQVDPKLDDKSRKTDFLQMLCTVLKHPGVSAYCSNMYEIKFDAPHILIKKESDIITPLIVLRYVFLLKEIVKKGLRRNYRYTNENLRSKIKGKILVESTIRKNHFQGKLTQTYCRYQEYSVDNLENRLLKRALVFGNRYLNMLKLSIGSDLIRFIYPAFSTVGSEVKAEDVRIVKLGGIYHEYNEALKLAKILLQRFGYNVNSISDEVMVKTPPFWIDMSLLFELYTLALLKNAYSGAVSYHLTQSGNELDFLLKTDDYRLVLDAKYRPKYLYGNFTDDIRQVSGYARLEKVYDYLEKKYPESIDCVIVYPDQEGGNENLVGVDLKANTIDPYLGIYKTSIKLPVQ